MTLILGPFHLAGVVVDFTLLGRALFYMPRLFVFVISHIFYNIKNVQLCTTCVSFL